MSTWESAECVTVDQELSAKLQSELQLEQDLSDTDELPPNIKDFLESSPFQLEDIPGQEEVVLTRTFGDEKYVNINTALSTEPPLSNALLSESE